jgi:threonyl-tRNA synthetase
MTHTDLDLTTLRHSASHIMASAVQDLFPSAKLGIGPAIENGFYYDFDIETPFSEDDIEKIENKMQQIIARKIPFEMQSMKKDAALSFFKERGEIYKCELIADLPDEELTLYKTGDFYDLCKGPHVSDTAEVRAFKLLSVAGAYWRGSEKNKMLTRIYGTAFFNPKELKKYLFQLEEAKKRDHRLLGKQLDLFSFHEEGPGFPFFHPKGLSIYSALIDYWREEHRREDYVEIKTPIILREQLWKQSGHYDHYKDHMYFTEMDGAGYAVKPMNCPGGLLVYRSHQHSYREFPLKVAELGQVHRHELSGVLHGLFRVKTFTIDDAHIFCLEDQIEAEVCKAIQLILKLYKTFSFDDVHMELSTRPEKSIGTDQVWEQSTDSLRKALDTITGEYTVNEGDGAFYGPKIDFHIRDSIGRSWQCGTVQLDFSMPERFDLEYVGADGAPHRPVMIHRAAFGSIERFMGILIEHYAGAFPLWLSPLQIRVISISEKFQDYAQTVNARLLDSGFKSDCDIRGEKIGYKIREAEALKINYMIIVGEKEVESDSISVRARGRKDLGSFSLDDFIKRLQSEIKVKE